MVRQELIGQSRAMVRAAKAKARKETAQRPKQRGMGPPPALVAKNRARRMPPSWYDRIIPLPVTKYLKPFAMVMKFSNRFVTAEVFDERSKELVASASSKEEVLREGLESLCDSLAAAKVGTALGQRLKDKGIPGVTYFLNNGELYHGKRKAFLENLRHTGIRFI